MKPRLKLSVQKVIKADGLPLKGQLKAWALTALQAKADQVEVTIRFVDEVEGQALNRDYRGKDYATNVLTFTYDDGPSIPGMPLMGDLVFCHPVVVREANEQGITLEAHYAHLVVHGILHLQGFDHEENADAEVMEALEACLLQGLGYPDPYAFEKSTAAKQNQ